MWFCSRPGHVQGGGKKEITGQRLSSGAVKTLFHSQDNITLSTSGVIRVNSRVRVVFKETFHTDLLKKPTNLARSSGHL